MSVRLNSLLNSHVEVAHAAALCPSDVTVRLRYCPDAQPNNNEGSGLIVKGSYDGGDNRSYTLHYFNDAGTYKLKFGVGNVGVDSLISKTITLTPGVWYEIAGTITAAGAAKLYIAQCEGQRYASPTAFDSVTTGNLASGPPASTGKLHIGSAGGGGSASLYGASGALARVQVYSAVLSQATLEGRMAARGDGTEANLVGSWQLDERSGLTAYDRASGTGRDGTLYNGALWAGDPLDLYYEDGDLRGQCLIGWPSWTRGHQTVISGSSEATAYPWSNLRCPRQATPGRTGASATLDLDISFDRARPVRALSVRNHNLSSVAVMTLKGDSDPTFASPPVSVTVPYEPEALNLVLAREYQYRYWRLSITDAGATGGYIQLGTCDLWAGLELADQPDATDARSLADPSGSVETQHGDRVARDLTASAEASFSWSQLRRGEAQELMRRLEEAGSGAALWLCRDVRRELARASYGYADKLPSERPANPQWTHTAVDGLHIREDRA